MAFDAGLMAAVVHELDCTISNSRAEKIYQPSKDMIILALKCERKSDMPEGARGDSVRLCIDAGASNPRINLTAANPENPAKPPMFCMLLRKHLTGARIISVKQLGFERAAEIEFETRDEMGFLTRKYIIAEIMGKCSNIIFCNSERRVIASVKTVDFTTSHKRQVLPGMKYELPPMQEGKASPLEETEAIFKEKRLGSELPDDKFIMGNYYGLSPLIAREIAYRSAGDADMLWREFSRIADIIKGCTFTPIAVMSPDGKPIEYSFTEIGQYGRDGISVVRDSFSSLIDEFFSEKSKNERIRQRSADLLRLLTNAETRLNKKIALQSADLKACADKEKYRQMGDLITSNIYRLKTGMKSVELVNYYSDDMETVKVELDSRLTPAQNAQKYYKKYNKSKSAEIALTKQLEISRNELEYINTVFDSLTKAESESDLSEIRRELHGSGYASRMSGYTEQRKIPAPKPKEFLTSGGYKVLCGKNNSQNDYLTFKLAGKGDIWFHVKGCPGSHVVLFCGGEEPDAKDFTEAAQIAAVYSKAGEGQKVAVDYTRIKNIKKPPASKPGYVTYSTNYTAYVDPDKKTVESLSV